ncbi:hypothetical protein ACFU0X_20435 [Streptomyces cellulosae]|uniref:Uncharacterized protein n=1 Tax=Streptomyces cellulosae TaxID=1968 RepID=A0ABW6JMN0_STRCE
MPDPRVTRVHTIRRHLDQGGLLDLNLSREEQARGPEAQERDGYSARQATRDGALMVVVGAYGPNWVRTCAELTGRLESSRVRCTVAREADGLEEHELLVRWATSEELHQRRRQTDERTAGVRALVRRQKAQARAEEERRALEDAGQESMF